MKDEFYKMIAKLQRTLDEQRHELHLNVTIEGLYSTGSLHGKNVAKPLDSAVRHLLEAGSPGPHGVLKAKKVSAATDLVRGVAEQLKAEQSTDVREIQTHHRNFATLRVWHSGTAVAADNRHQAATATSWDGELYSKEVRRFPMFGKRDALIGLVGWFGIALTAMVSAACEMADEEIEYDLGELTESAHLEKGCVDGHDNLGKGKWSFRWSYRGPISGMHCVQINEPADPHTWDDNFLCAKKDFHLKWSHSGPIAGMHCLQIKEPSDPHTWDDNYLCSSTDLGLVWSHRGKPHGKKLKCVQFLEPSDSYTWKDNYLCGPKNIKPGDPVDECTSGACCGADGTILPAGTICRATKGSCDADETCTGASAECPVDALFGDDVRCDDAPVEFERRCSGDACGADVQQRAAYLHCSGTSVNCDTGDENVRWEAWKVATDCGANAICDDSPFLPGPICRTCDFGCSDGQCE
jgi:hypothetical protein